MNFLHAGKVWGWQSDGDIPGVSIPCGHNVTGRTKKEAPTSPKELDNTLAWQRNVPKETDRGYGIRQEQDSSCARTP